MMWLLLLFSFLNLLTVLAAFGREKKRKLKSFPKVSILCRVWDDEEVVERFIKNCLDQDYPNLEIIIADDASTDDTPKICEKYARKGLIKFYRAKRHHEKKAGLMNKVIKEMATGEIILATDVDAVFSKGWVKELVRHLQKSDAVSAPVIGGNFTTWMSKIRIVEDFWLFGASMLGRYRLLGKSALYGSNTGIKLDVLRKVGYYSMKTLTEDAELSLEVMSRFKTSFCDRAIVLVEDVEDLKSYLNERKRWLHGTIRSSLLHKGDIVYGTLTVINYTLSFQFLLSLFSLSNPFALLSCLLNLSSILLSLKRFEAKREVYLWVLPYLLLDPFLQALTLIGISHDLLRYGKVRWVKVSGEKYHLGRELKPPFKGKVFNP